jgi:hypothetical protein
MPIIPIEEIKKNQKLFKKQFIRSFNLELEQIHGLAIGEISPKVKYSKAGSITKIIIESGAKVAGSFITPVGGSAVGSLIMSIPIGIYEYYQKKGLIQDAVDSNNYILKFDTGIIESVIEETAHEITRIFEYQIAMIKHPNDVQRLADFAISKILKNAINDDGVVDFNQNSLLRALIIDHTPDRLKKAQYKFTGEQKLQTKADFTWSMYKIFSKPGLREEIDNGGYSYLVKTDSIAKDIKYGYRGKIFAWDEDSRSFVYSILDNECTQTPPADNEIEFDARSYRALMRLVSQLEVDIYVDHILPDKRIEGERASFIRFFNEVNYYNMFNEVNRHYTQTEIIPVFRAVKFAPRTLRTDLDLSNSDFSYADMTRISFQ